MKTLLLLSLVALTAGCRVTYYASPHGGRMLNAGLGNKTQLDELSIQPTTNGVPRVTMKGYRNDQAATAEGIAYGVSRAIMQQAPIPKIGE